MVVAPISRGKVIKNPSNTMFKGVYRKQVQWFVLIDNQRSIM